MLGIYCPHEGVDVEARERFFDELNGATTSYSKAGPVLACGDLNTHLKYRYAEESAFFGPHLFDCQGPPAVQTVDTNRDLLAQYCSATGMAVKNTFLHKSTHQQITFYDRWCRTYGGFRSTLASTAGSTSVFFRLFTNGARYCLSTRHSCWAHHASLTDCKITYSDSEDRSATEEKTRENTVGSLAK